MGEAITCEYNDGWRWEPSWGTAQGTIGVDWRLGPRPRP